MIKKQWSKKNKEKQNGENHLYDKGAYFCYAFSIYILEKNIKEAQQHEANIVMKIGRSLINNLVTNDTTWLAQSEDDLKHPIIKIKELSLKMGLYINVWNKKILTTGSINNFSLKRRKNRNSTQFQLAWINNQ